MTAVNDPSSTSGRLGLRRPPRQERSLARIKTILDTAERQFAELGYDRTTTNAIAAEANISIGSLYHYFPDRRAVATALAGRYAAGLETVMAEVGDQVAGRPRTERIDVIVRQAVGFARASSRSYAVLQSWRTAPEVSYLMDRVLAPAVESITELLRILHPHLDDNEIHVIISTSIEAAWGVLGLVISAPDEVTAERYTRELVCLLDAYVGSKFPDGEVPMWSGALDEPSPSERE